MEFWHKNDAWAATRGLWIMTRRNTLKASAIFKNSYLGTVQLIGAARRMGKIYKIFGNIGKEVSHFKIQS